MFPMSELSHTVAGIMGTKVMCEFEAFAAVSVASSGMRDVTVAATA